MNPMISVEGSSKKPWKILGHFNGLLSWILFFFPPFISKYIKNHTSTETPLFLCHVQLPPPITIYSSLFRSTNVQLNHNHIPLIDLFIYTTVLTGLLLSTSTDLNGHSLGVLSHLKRLCNQNSEELILIGLIARMRKILYVNLQCSSLKHVIGNFVR